MPVQHGTVAPTYDAPGGRQQMPAQTAGDVQSAADAHIGTQAVVACGATTGIHANPGQHGNEMPRNWQYA